MAENSRAIRIAAGADIIRMILDQKLDHHIRIDAIYTGHLLPALGTKPRSIDRLVLRDSLCGASLRMAVAGLTFAFSNFEGGHGQPFIRRR